MLRPSSFCSRLCGFRYNARPPRLQRFSFPRSFSAPVRPAEVVNPVEIPKSTEPPASLYESLSFANRAQKPVIRNQILFFLSGSSLLFVYAAWRTNFETEVCKEQVLAGSTILSPLALGSVDLRRWQQTKLMLRLRAGYSSIAQGANELPSLVRAWTATAYVTLLQPWADAGHGKRVCWEICLANAFVYMLWKMPRMVPMMTARFTHQPLSGLSFTLLTSVFSHAGLLHLFFNCYALEGFGSSAANFLLREQERTSTQLESTPIWHFLAFYCSAGVFAALTHHIVTAKFLYPRAAKQIASTLQGRAETWAAALSSSARSAGAAAAKPAADAAAHIKPILGASGAVYACVVMTALAYPQAQIALAIPPTFPINIQWGVGAMLCLDLVGALRGWKLLAHWAHLGGAAFGAVYYYYGPQVWNKLRQTLATQKKDDSTS